MATIRNAEDAKGTFTPRIFRGKIQTPVRCLCVVIAGQRSGQREKSRRGQIMNPNPVSLALNKLHRPSLSEADARGATILAAWDSVHGLQRRLESKWGVGQLQALSPPDLRGKFARALARFNKALDRDNPVEVEQRASALYRGWIALQDAALEAGHEAKVADQCWVWRSEEGKAFAICKDHDARLDALGHLDSCTVWTLDEIGRVLHYLVLADPMLGQIKEMFGGEVIEIVRGIQKQGRKPKNNGKAEEKPFFDDPVPF